MVISVHVYASHLYLAQSTFFYNMLQCQPTFFHAPTVLLRLFYVLLRDVYENYTPVWLRQYTIYAQHL
jgi:hypothetical protein